MVSSEFSAQLDGQIGALAKAISRDHHADRHGVEEFYRTVADELWRRICLEVETARQAEHSVSERQHHGGRKPQTLWADSDLADTWFLEGNGKVQALVEFLDECGARSDKEVAACSIAYLCKRVQPVTFAHVIAAFKRLGVPDVEPQSLQATLYELASRRGQFRLKHPHNGQRLELTPSGLAYVQGIRKKYARSKT